MTKKEFDVMVLDEQTKWAPGGAGTLLVESKGEVKLPKSEGKTQDEKKVDPVEITPDMYGRLTFGRNYVKLPENVHALAEGKKDKLPENIHQKMSEAFGG